MHANSMKRSYDFLVIAESRGQDLVINLDHSRLWENFFIVKSAVEAKL